MRNFDAPLEPENTEAEVIPFQRNRVEPEASQSLLPRLPIGDLHTRWDAIQASFVDEPGRAVKDADALVATTIQQISEAFANERQQLEKQCSRGDDVSTEDLRLALQRYRTLFSRILSVLDR
jgi:hypothetical protein